VILQGMRSIIPVAFILFYIVNADDGLIEDFDEEELEHRNSLNWGRMFLEGGVAHHQYFKARFGGDIPFGKQRIVVSNPIDACSPIQTKSAEGAIVFAERGNCTFATKARFAQQAGAKAFICISTGADLTHLPGPDGKDIEIGVAMVTKDYGTYVQELAKRQTVIGQMLPIYCEKETGTSVCLPVTEQEKAQHKVAEGGRIVWDGQNEPVEFLTAKFGTPVPANSLNLVVADPPKACQELTNAADVKGKAVLMERGGCTFTDKAVNVQAAGGFAAIMINSQPTLLRMDALKRYEAYNISVSTMMVTKSAGEKLKAIAASSPHVKFDLSQDIKAVQWESLRNSVSAEQWPLDFEGRKEFFLKLQSENAESAERLAYLTDAFIATGTDAEQYLSSLKP